MRNKKRIYYIISGIIVIISIFLSVAASATIKVEPSRYIIYMKEGARVTETINVTNNTDQTLDLVAKFYDWDMNDDYELQTHELGSLDSSLNGFFRFNPRKFKLNPGQTQIVRFTIQIPETKESKERRGIIFIEHESDPGEGMGAKIITKIGTTVYAIPENTGFNFNVLDSKIIQNEKGDIFGAFLTQNVGNRHMRFEIKYTIVDNKGKEIEKNSVEEKVLLPNMKRGVIFPIETKLESGEYQINAKFTLPDTDKTLNRNIKFKVGG
ncbi:MAG: hypothetical protein ACQEQD_08990 [Bacillota bacterium]